MGNIVNVNGAEISILSINDKDYTSIKGSWIDADWLGSN